eukprot:TRINITY_DN4718_c0_g1_i1.p1 TRINITY_DN4718_c0_g1~~TRINITY_DN4718_c0_g1_i1.p1  ORF type:complete len:583 (-),score=130.72 TRINITY_DN4718_c0_g1_i1:23-1603(-)
MGKGQLHLGLSLFVVIALSIIHLKGNLTVQMFLTFLFLELTCLLTILFVPPRKYILQDIFLRYIHLWILLSVVLIPIELKMDINTNGMDWQRIIDTNKGIFVSWKNAFLQMKGPIYQPLKNTFPFKFFPEITSIFSSCIEPLILIQSYSVIHIFSMGVGFFLCLFGYEMWNMLIFGFSYLASFLFLNFGGNFAFFLAQKIFNENILQFFDLLIITALAFFLCFFSFGEMGTILETIVNKNEYSVSGKIPKTSLFFNLFGIFSSFMLIFVLSYWGHYNKNFWTIELARYLPVFLSFFLSYYYSMVYTEKKKKDRASNYAIVLSSLFVSIIGGRSVLWLLRTISPSLARTPISFFQLSPSDLKSLNPHKMFVGYESISVLTYLVVFISIVLFLIFNCKSGHYSLLFARSFTFLFILSSLYQSSNLTFYYLNVVSYNFESLLQFFASFAFLILGAKLSFSMPLLTRMIVSSVVGAFLILSSLQFFLPVYGALSLGLVSLAALFIQISSYFKDHNILLIAGSKLINEHDY